LALWYTLPKRRGHRARASRWWSASFPQLLLALASVAALGPSLFTIIVVLGLTGWERYTRVVRAEVLAPRAKDFVEAVRAMGASPLRTILRHLLPNTFSSIIVMSGRPGHPAGGRPVLPRRGHEEHPSHL